VCSPDRGSRGRVRLVDDLPGEMPASARGVLRSSSVPRAAAKVAAHSSLSSGSSGYSFYELVSRLTSEYDRTQGKVNELTAENTRLRADLSSMTLMSSRGEPQTPPPPREKFCASLVGGGGKSKVHTQVTPRETSLDAALAPANFAAPDDLEDGKPIAPAQDGNLPGLRSSSGKLREEIGGIKDSGNYDSSVSTAAPAESGKGFEDSQRSICTIPEEHTSPSDLMTVQMDTNISLLALTDNSNTEPARSRAQTKDSVDSELSNISLKPVWKEGLFIGRRGSGSRGPSAAAQTALFTVTRSGYIYYSDRAGDTMQEKCCLQPFVTLPNSWKCFFWDIITATMMVYDLFIIPLAAFEIENRFTVHMDWVTASIWSADVFVTFLRGVDIGGVVELRPTKIAWYYVRGWFMIDIFALAVDWLAILFHGSEDVEFLKNLRLRRLVRVLRIVRLIRIAKLANRESLKELVGSQPMNYIVVVAIVKLLIVMLVLNHYVACAWYAIGNFERVSGRKSWLTENVEPEHSGFYQYATSFHWSMTQFTPASMEVFPVNVWERCFTVCVIFSGLIMFSSFLSNTTSAMAQFQKMTSEQQKQKRAMKRYIADHHMSLSLQNSINIFLQSNKKARMEVASLHEQDIMAFRALPQNLLMRLHEEVFGPIIAEHALLNKLHKAEGMAFGSICHPAMAERTLGVGEELFRCGARGTQMFFLVRGTLNYFWGYQEAVPLEVNQGEWMCEAALWTDWVHRGRTTTSLMTCELYTLEASEFQTIVSKTQSLPEIQRYAKFYSSRAVQDSGGAENLTDIWGNKVEVKKVVDRAFDKKSNERTINKVVMLLDSVENRIIHVFSAWRQVALREKEERLSKQAKRKCVPCCGGFSRSKGT